MASLSGYAYAVQDEKLFVNLYAQGTAATKVNGQSVKVAQETDYPWSGAIKLTVDPADADASFSLCLRIPGWVQGKPVPSDLYTYENPAPAKCTVKVNGQPVKPRLVQGFAMIDRNWKTGDVVELDLPMPVRRVEGNSKIDAVRGQVALERGPVVYAFEGIDNDGAVFDIELPADATAKPVFKPELLGGITMLEVNGAKRMTRLKSGKTEERPVIARAIPYASWNNRGLSPMSVWMGRDAGHVRPTAEPTAASSAKLSVSFVREGMDPARINDQLIPRNATDGFAPQFDFWPHKGGTEWVMYEFEKPIEIKGVTVSWFDDTGKGDCRLPKSWNVQYQDADEKWTPVKGASAYEVRRSTPVSVTFRPVKTRALRIELQLEDGFSAGLYEWEVMAEE